MNISARNSCKLKKIKIEGVPLIGAPSIYLSRFLLTKKTVFFIVSDPNVEFPKGNGAISKE
jgi:hypothetical protein